MRGLLGALALFGILSSVPHGAAAQRTGAVVGLVNDSDGQPLADVLVFIGDGTAATLTDELGLFGLFALPLEQHVLSYRKAGYEPRSFALDLSTDVDFRDVGALVLTPGPEPTATLIGRVVEEQNGPGLAGAVVELNGRVVAETDSSGAFSVPGSPVMWGANELIVRHRAFADRTVSDRLWVADVNETFDLVVAMDIEPIPLPGVGVTVQSARLAAAGFYERREQLRSATFLTREQIAEMNPRRTEDLLQRALAGAGMSRTLRQSTAGVGGPGTANLPAQTFGNAQGGQACLPVLYLDGLRMTQLNTPAGLSSELDQLVAPEAIEGIEIYESISGLPVRYSPIGSVCGVILIWTR
jgi:hypothetical protein